MNQDIIRVLRLIEYEGPRDVVEKQLKMSLHGTREGVRINGRTCRITAVTLDQFPKILEEARNQPAIDLDNEAPHG